MSLDSMREAVTADFNTKLATTSFSTIPVRYENHPFNQPTNSDYLYIYLKHVDDLRANIGTVQRYQKHMGFIVVECFAREGTGTKALNTYMDTIAAFFEEKSVTLADGEVLTTRTAKKATNGLQFGFYRGTVLVPTIRRSCKV